MTLTKSELIHSVASQFKAQIKPGMLRKLHITSGFFNTGLPAEYKRKTIGNDLGQLTRIFDSVTLDRSTTEQFYNAVLLTDDPVQDILVPVLGLIADDLFAQDQPELHEDIKKDFKQYNEVRSKFTDEKFKKVMLDAALIGCSSILTGFHKHHTESLRSVDMDEELRLNKQFMAKVAGPIEKYTLLLTPEKLAEDRALSQQNSPEQPRRSGLVLMIIRALLSIVNIFSRKTNSEPGVQLELRNIVKESPIENKVRTLFKAVDSVFNMLNPACQEAEAASVEQVILKEVRRFRAHLDSLITEIEDSREEHMEFEVKVELGFNSACESFSNQMNEFIKKDDVLSTAEQETMVALVQDLIAQISPSLEKTEDLNATDDESDSAKHTPKKN